MRRVVAGVMVAAMLAMTLTVAMAERAWKPYSYTAVPIRVINAGNLQRFDTLAVRDGERLTVNTFSLWGDDSAAAAVAQVEFMSLNSRTRYLRFTATYTSAQVKNDTWSGPWVFPKDSTIIISYSMASGVLDSALATMTYQLERP
jgi:hypothetical protein